MSSWDVDHEARYNGTISCVIASMPLSSPDVTALTDNELEARAWHVLSVARLKKQCNPWACWIEQETPITPVEVQYCLDLGTPALVETPLWTAMLYGKSRMTAEENRQRHIQKIAYFVLHEITAPISIDVGSEALGWYPDHLVEDGNHRLAAAIFKRARTINAKVGGSVRDAQQRGFYNPNVYEMELVRRQLEAMAVRRSRPKKASLPTR